MIIVLVLCVVVFALVVLVFSERAKTRMVEKKIGPMQEGLDLANRQLGLQTKALETLSKDLLSRAEAVAATKAENVFKVRGEEIISALVAGAMQREHSALSSVLQGKLEELRIVQTARIDNVTKAVDDTSNILTRMLRRLHVLPQKSNGQLAPDASPQGE